MAENNEKTKLSREEISVIILFAIMGIFFVIDIIMFFTSGLKW